MQTTSNPYRAAERASFVPAPAPRLRPFGRSERYAALGFGVLFASLVAGHGWLLTTRWGAPLVMSLMPVLLLIATRRFRLSPRLGVLTAVFGLALVRCAWRESFGAWAVVVPSFVAMSIAMRSRNVSVLEGVASLFAMPRKLPMRIASFFVGFPRKDATRQVQMRAIVIPLALVLAFGIVFSLANPVLREVALRCARAVAEGSAADAMPFIAFAFGVLFAIPALRPTVRFRKTDESLVEAPQDVLVARNALFALNGIFAAYNLLDVVHLWAGAPPWGTSTQAYAHDGAFWLTISLAMTTVTAAVLFRHGVVQRRLAFAWLAQNLFLGLGTYRRIAIHVSTSGLSSLRIAGMVGTTVVLSGVVLVAWKLFSRKSTMWLVRRQLDAAVLGLALFAVAPTHMIGARVNVARIEAGDYRALVHVHEQARETESAAELLPLLDHPDLRVRQGVAVYLRQKLRCLHRGMDTGFSMGEGAARTNVASLLEPHHERLDALAPDDTMLQEMDMFETLQRTANRGEDLGAIHSL